MIMNKYADIFQKLYHNMSVFAYHAYPKVTFTYPRQNLKAEGRSGYLAYIAPEIASRLGSSRVIVPEKSGMLWKVSVP